MKQYGIGMSMFNDFIANFEHNRIFRYCAFNASFKQILTRFELEGTHTEAYLQSCQTSLVKYFSKIVNLLTPGFQACFPLLATCFFNRHQALEFLTTKSNVKKKNVYEKSKGFHQYALT